jgi:SAM-dependent methyltransferase
MTIASLERNEKLQREELQRVYQRRFAGKGDYRVRIWKVLVEFFSQWIPRDSRVLDLGAGYCEFINAIPAGARYAMDLNPDTRQHADPGVLLLEQDCSEPWELPDGSLDVVFTSNFLEHLPNKEAVSRTLLEAQRCLRPGGRFVALGPNIKYAPGEYWDFFDHYVPLTELSLAESLSNSGFAIEQQTARFLPYTMSRAREHPLWMLRLYLKLPALWSLFGKQFLVVGRKR